MKSIILTPNQIGKDKLTMNMEQPPPGYEFEGITAKDAIFEILGHPFESDIKISLPIIPRQTYWVQEEWHGLQIGECFSSGVRCGSIYSIFYKDGTSKEIETNEIFSWNYLWQWQPPSSMPQKFSRWNVTVGGVTVGWRDNKWVAIYPATWEQTLKK